MGSTKFVAAILLVVLLAAIVFGAGFYYFSQRNKPLSISQSYNELPIDDSIAIDTKDFMFRANSKLVDSSTISGIITNYNNLDKFRSEKSEITIEITRYTGATYTMLGLKELTNEALLDFLSTTQSILVGGETIKTGETKLGEINAVFAITKNARDSAEYLLEVNIINEGDVYVFEMSADESKFNSNIDIFLESLSTLKFKEEVAIQKVFDNLVVDDSIKSDLDAQITKFVIDNKTNYPYLESATINYAYIDLESRTTKANTFSEDFKFNPGTSFLNLSYLMLLESGKYNLESILNDAPSTNSKVRNLNGAYLKDIELNKAISNKLINALLNVNDYQEVIAALDNAYGLGDYKIETYDDFIGNSQISIRDFAEIYSNFALQSGITETSSQNYFQINNIRSSRFQDLKGKVVTDVGYSYDDTNVNFVFYDNSKLIIVAIESDSFKNDPVEKFQLIYALEDLVTKYFADSKGILRPEGIEKLYN